MTFIDLSLTLTLICIPWILHGFHICYEISRIVPRCKTVYMILLLALHYFQNVRSCFTNTVLRIIQMFAELFTNTTNNSVNSLNMYKKCTNVTSFHLEGYYMKRVRIHVHCLSKWEWTLCCLFYLTISYFICYWEFFSSFFISTIY